jgi:hypothetical protein
MHRSSWLVFISVIVLSILVKTTIIAENNLIRYDDALSYLMATGHTRESREIEINNLPPQREWSDVATWKRLIQIDEPGDYQKISQDLAEYDKHPPLFFWALHLWLKLLGVRYWVGPILNLVIDIIFAFVLFLFARRCLKNNLEAVIVSATWILSPISIQTSTWVRQYSLFSMIGYLFAMLSFTYFFASNRRAIPFWSAVGLVIITTAGFLVHYYFIVFTLIAGILIFIKTLLIEKNIKPLFSYLIILGMAFILFLVIFPGFFTSISRFQPELLAESDTIFRLKRTIYIGGLLFSPVFLAILLVIIHGRYFSTSQKENHHPNPLLTIWIISFVAALWIIITILFLTRISPQQSMGAKYVNVITPFVAFLAILIIRLFSSPSKTILYSMLGGMVLLSLMTLVPVVKNFLSNRIDVRYLHNADVVVLDNIKTGNWPAIIFQLQPGDQIFLAQQPYLLANPQEWLPRFCSSNSIYVSMLFGGGNSISNTEAIFNLISQECNITLVTELYEPKAIIKIFKH